MKSKLALALTTLLAYAPLEQTYAEERGIISWTDLKIQKNIELKVETHPFHVKNPLQFEGTWKLTEVGGCGSFFQGDLTLELSGESGLSPKKIRASNVPLRNFCEESQEKLRSSSANCTVKSDYVHNLLSGWKWPAPLNQWSRDAELSSNQARYSSYPEIRPVNLFDIDFDGEIEVIIPSLCNIRMSPLYHVFELEDLMEEGSTTNSVQPALSFLSNTIFDFETRTATHYESNTSCDYSKKSWVYDFNRKRFVIDREEQNQC